MPDENTCGIYEREVWGQVCFVVEGVASRAFVYVNGNYIGVAQGSHLQAEFDVTDAVRKGTNSLRLR